jgi:hypothetical protein
MTMSAAELRPAKRSKSRAVVGALPVEEAGAAAAAASTSTYATAGMPWPSVTLWVCEHVTTRCVLLNTQLGLLLKSTLTDTAKRMQLFPPH